MGDVQDLLRHGADYVIKKNKIKICCSLPFIILFIVLSNIIYIHPSFKLKKLYIPALQKSSNISTDATITFHFSFENSNPFQGVYYDPINVTFYDSPSQNHSIANFTIPKFSQRIDSEVDRRGTANATGLEVEAAKREIATNGFKVFHLGLETSVRYQLYVFWKTKRHGYRRGVDVKIGDSGAANFEVKVWVMVTVVLVVLLIIGIFIFLCCRCIKS
ncbi:hypothetical protein LUZ61_004701 [Rhynchospora tenuis]|uniref:Late embryogenesis abundant protein LEA-2 subgroup domain-containing protein n=1 Tax=Rhynchospora tenuis TaxID=198213 RepID=A0AAD5ZN65_9POAL|nr:hypothetical protein LUZ61_004701 [Rhynchospora tenuis]